MILLSTKLGIKQILMAAYVATMALLSGLFILVVLPMLVDSPACFFGPNVRAVSDLCDLNRLLTWFVVGFLLFGGSLPIGLLGVAVWLRRRLISIATIIALSVTFMLFAVWGVMSLSIYGFDWMQLLATSTLPMLHLLLLSLSLRRESLRYLNVL